MLVVNLLHKFELGVWKALFTHLIRVLYAAASDGSLVAEMDRRQVNFSFLSSPQLITFRAYPHLARAQSGVLQQTPQK